MFFLKFYSQAYKNKSRIGKCANRWWVLGIETLARVVWMEKCESVERDDR